MKKKEIRVAITGNIACGKSILGKFLEDLGYLVVDTDLITHELLNSLIIKEEILNICAFYNINVLDTLSGLIDRKKLAKVFFENFELKKKIENILHPKIKDEIESVKIEGTGIMFVLIPLLFELNWQQNYNYNILVFCSPEIQLERLKSRNPDLSEEDCKRRINSQMPQEQKKELANFIIDNSGTFDQSKKQMLEIIELIV